MCVAVGGVIINSTKIVQEKIDFVRDIHAKFGISNLFQSPGIGQNLDLGISDFQISGKSLINKKLL